MTRYKPVTKARKAYDYLVFKDGDYYKVQDGDSLQIVHKDKNASTAIAKAINLLTPDRTWKEIIKLKGSFVLSSPITLDSCMIFDLSGAKLTLIDGVNDSIIKADGKSNIEIIGGILDGNRNAQTKGSGIAITNSEKITVRDTLIQNIIWTGLSLNQTSKFSVERVIVDTAGVSQYGAGIETTNNCWDGIIAGCKTYNTGSSGIIVNGSSGASGRISIIGCQTYKSGYNGIFLYFNVFDVSVIGCVVRNVTFGWGIEIENASKCTVQGCSVLDSSPSIGIKIMGSSALFNSVIGNVVSNVGRHLIAISGGAKWNRVIGNYLEATWTTDTIYDGISIGGADDGGGNGSGGQYGNIIANNIIRAPSIYNRLRHGIREYGDSTVYNIIENNIIRGVIFSSKIKWVGTETIVRHNIGFVTENSGEAIITAGNTYVDVSHGLDITPDINKIRITPKDNLNGRDYWISDVNSSIFRINISSSDSVDHTFGWSYYN